MEVINYASPNFGERAPGLSVNLLLIHYTGMKTCDQALQRLCDPSAGVSSHYLIKNNGEVVKCLLFCAYHDLKLVLGNEIV